MMDLLSRSRALRTLVDLAKTQPATMRQFLDASGYTWESGDILLHDLIDAGLLTLGEFRQGIVRSRVITLTPKAHEIVKLGASIDEIMQRPLAGAPGDAPPDAPA